MVWLIRDSREREGWRNGSNFQERKRKVRNALKSLDYSLTEISTVFYLKAGDVCHPHTDVFGLGSFVHYDDDPKNRQNIMY